jgi:hypothetical protein
MKVFSLFIDKKQNNFFFEKPNNQKQKNKKLNKMSIFQLRQSWIIFFQKFHGLVLGLVELIDAKGIDVALPIWPWGCPT